MERSLLRSQFSTIQRVDVCAVPNLPFDDGIIGLLKLLKQPRLVGSRNAWAGVVADRIYRGSGIIRFRGRYRGARPARVRTPRSRAHFPTRRMATETGLAGWGGSPYRTSLSLQIEEMQGHFGKMQGGGKRGLAKNARISSA
jgi:hypothetical protein